MKTHFLLLTLLLLAGTTFAQTHGFQLVKRPTENSTTGKRKAVVIGMSNYGAGKSLNNTLNDANDMAGALTRLGFKVTLLKDNDLQDLKTNLSNWYKSIGGNDTVVFYFAGSGIGVNGENYLIPRDAELNLQTDIKYNALNVNQVLDSMNEKRVGIKLLIFDTCFDIPFERDSERKVVVPAVSKDTFIAFAGSPIAQDGTNYNLQNGVFTYYLKQEILKSGISLDEIFNNVALDVSGLTGDQQTPFKISSLMRKFYFIPPQN